MKLIDSFNRVHDYVRISLIDKCNLNCIYCNPSNSLARFESNKSILTYEELFRLIKILVRDLEVKKIRFTGGEPLIRKDVMKFFEMISSLKNQYDFEIGITTIARSFKSFNLGNVYSRKFKSIVIITPAIIHLNPANNIGGKSATPILIAR